MTTPKCDCISIKVNIPVVLMLISHLSRQHIAILAQSQRTIRFEPIEFITIAKCVVIIEYIN